MVSPSAIQPPSLTTAGTLAGEPSLVAFFPQRWTPVTGLAGRLPLRRFWITRT